MRRHLLLTLALLLLPGCTIYTSAVPLAEAAAAPFDELLLGEWAGPDGDKPADGLPLRVYRFNEHEYLVEWHELTSALSSDPPKRTDHRARMFITKIDSVPFLNIQDLPGDTFVFARYTLTGDELRLRFIANQEEDRKGLTGPYATSAALHAAVRARLHDPLLYDQAESEVTALRRVRDETTPEP